MNRVAGVAGCEYESFGGDGGRACARRGEGRVECLTSEGLQPMTRAVSRCAVLTMATASASCSSLWVIA